MIKQEIVDKLKAIDNDYWAKQEEKKFLVNCYNHNICPDCGNELVSFHDNKKRNIFSRKESEKLICENCNNGFEIYHNSQLNKIIVENNNIISTVFIQGFNYRSELKIF